jgi:YfiR/HmsC-like
MNTLKLHESARQSLFITCILLMSLSKTCAQHETDYKIQANIIYRFTKYIDWPINKKAGDFVIGVIGESPLYDDLQRLSANKTVGGQKIVVVKMSPAATSYDCHMLFIGEEESSSLKKIAILTASAPILIISESEGLARKGSCINFITVDDRLKLEINKGNVEQRNLGIASELLELGIIIK